MTKNEYELHNGVKIWNILASIFFIILCILMYMCFLTMRPENFSINIFDIVILSLANFRLIRLFIYDNMTLFIRESFMDLKIQDDKYEFVHSKNSFKLTMYKLMTCPWCFGVWAAFVSSFLYFTFPVFVYVFIILAISAVASFLMLLTNLIGWYAEGKKREVDKNSNLLYK